VKEALRNVLIEAPNHLSARLLLGHGAGQFNNFSLAGSIETVEQRAPNIVRAARCTVPSVVAGIPADRPADELAKLKALREKLDDHALPWLDALIRYGTAVNNWHANPRPHPRAKQPARRRTQRRRPPRPDRVAEAHRLRETPK